MMRPVVTFVGGCCSSVDTISGSDSERESLRLGVRSFRRAFGGGIPDETSECNQRYERRERFEGGEGCEESVGIDIRLDEGEKVASSHSEAFSLRQRRGQRTRNATVLEPGPIEASESITANSSGGFPPRERFIKTERGVVQCAAHERRKSALCVYDWSTTQPVCHLHSNDAIDRLSTASSDHEACDDLRSREETKCGAESQRQPSSRPNDSRLLKKGRVKGHLVRQLVAYYEGL